MTEPVVFRKSFSIALVALLQAILPAAVAVGSLIGLCSFYDVEFDNHFATMSVLVAVLATALLAVHRNGGSSLELRTAPLAFNVLVRWMGLLGILLAIAYMTKASEEFSRRVVVTWAIVTPALLIPGILALHELMRRLMYDPPNSRRPVFAGCTEASLCLARRLQASSDMCITVAGFFDDRNAARLQLGHGLPLLGSLSDLPAYVREHGIDVIFIALPVRHVQRVSTVLDELRDTTASIYYVPDIYMSDLIQARSGELHGVPVIAMFETPFAGFRGVTKRLTDIVLTTCLLVVAAPLMLLIAIAIRVSSPGPVIFKQRRYGLDGREIVVYKFRTMTVVEDGPNIAQATRQDSRVTPVGRILRRYSLDELPQLINVLQGRMSLVGPRPHAVAHNEMYRKLIKGYMLRHKVLPGITGLAQVNGLRGETRTVQQMEARVRYDLEYLRNWSILLDLKILAKTALRVLADDKAY